LKSVFPWSQKWGNTSVSLYMSWLKNIGYVPVICVSRNLYTPFPKLPRPKSSLRRHKILGWQIQVFIIPRPFFPASCFATCIYVQMNKLKKYLYIYIYTITPAFCKVSPCENRLRHPGTGVTAIACLRSGRHGWNSAEINQNASRPLSGRHLTGGAIRSCSPTG